jgi:hypothetical protein
VRFASTETYSDEELEGEAAVVVYVANVEDVPHSKLMVVKWLFGSTSPSRVIDVERALTAVYRTTPGGGIAPLARIPKGRATLR